MNLRLLTYKILVRFSIASLLSTFVYAQEDNKKDLLKELTPISQDALRYEDDSIDGYREALSFSAESKAQTCKKFRSTYIGYGDSIYKVEGCTLREIDPDSSEFWKATRGRIKVVENEVFANLWESSEAQKAEKNEKKTLENHVFKLDEACRNLNKKVVKYTDLDYDYYFVEKCAARLIPDDETLRSLLPSTGNLNNHMITISPERFSALNKGEDLPSVMDALYRELYKDSSSVPEIISIKEACLGLNGKDVTYVEKIYRIENCKKRPYNASKFLRESKNKSKKYKELSSTQWISLPAGKPMP